MINNNNKNHKIRKHYFQHEKEFYELYLAVSDS